jgi:hypothetical protein
MEHMQELKKYIPKESKQESEKPETIDLDFSESYGKY